MHAMDTQQTPKNYVLYCNEEMDDSLIDNSTSNEQPKVHQSPSSMVVWAVMHKSKKQDPIRKSSVRFVKKN